jgi:Ni/Co efflux regulator RcnB
MKQSVAFAALALAAATLTPSAGALAAPPAKVVVHAPAGKFVYRGVYYPRIKTVWKAPPRWAPRRYVVGAIVPPVFLAAPYIVDVQRYELPPPPPGAVWVRVDKDLLMVDQATGRVLEVIENAYL